MSFSVVASCGLLPGPAHELFLVVASCGLLPRATRPGPRLRTAYPAVAILPLRETHGAATWSASPHARRAGRHERLLAFPPANGGSGGHWRRALPAAWLRRNRWRLV